MRREDVKASAQLVDAGVEDALVRPAVAGLAQWPEQPLALVLDRPPAQDDDPAILCEPAVPAQHLRLVRVVVGEPVQHHLAVAIAVGLLQQDDVVALEMVGHQRRTHVLGIPEDRQQKGVEGQDIERDLPAGAAFRPGRGLGQLRTVRRSGNQGDAEEEGEASLQGPLRPVPRPGTALAGRRRGAIWQPSPQAMKHAHDRFLHLADAERPLVHSMFDACGLAYAVHRSTSARRIRADIMRKRIVVPANFLFRQSAPAVDP